jgi:hypothetical protein
MKRKDDPRAMTSGVCGRSCPLALAFVCLERCAVGMAQNKTGFFFFFLQRLASLAGKRVQFN